MWRLPIVLLPALLLSAVAHAAPLLNYRCPVADGCRLDSDATGTNVPFQFNATKAITGAHSTWTVAGATKLRLWADGSMLLGPVATAALRGTCTTGEVVFDSTAALLKVCATNTWYTVRTAYSTSASSGLAQATVDYDEQALRLKACPVGGLLKSTDAGGAWDCDDDDDTTYSAATSTVLGLVKGTGADTKCAGTNKSTGFDAAGALQCAADLNTTYSAGDGIDLNMATFSLAVCTPGYQISWNVIGDRVCLPAGSCVVTVPDLDGGECDTASTCSNADVTESHLIIATPQDAAPEATIVFQRAWAANGEVYFRFCNTIDDVATGTAVDVTMAWEAH
jgi:hypothetical protein